MACALGAAEADIASLTKESKIIKADVIQAVLVIRTYLDSNDPVGLVSLGEAFGLKPRLRFDELGGSWFEFEVPHKRLAKLVLMDNLAFADCLLRRAVGQKFNIVNNGTGRLYLRTSGRCSWDAGKPQNDVRVGRVIAVAGEGEAVMPRPGFDTLDLRYAAMDVGAGRMADQLSRAECDAETLKKLSKVPQISEAELSEVRELLGRIEREISRRYGKMIRSGHSPADNDNIPARWKHLG